eukprot:PhF_6_TR29665/c0_g1_i1/m.43746
MAPRLTTKPLISQTKIWSAMVLVVPTPGQLTTSAVRKVEQQEQRELQTILATTTVSSMGTTILTTTAPVDHPQPPTALKLLRSRRTLEITSRPHRQAANSRRLLETE